MNHNFFYKPYQIFFDSVNFDRDVNDRHECGQRKPKQNVTHQTPAVTPTLQAEKKEFHVKKLECFKQTVFKLITVLQLNHSEEICD